MKKKRLTLKDLNPPYVVLANTYFWGPGRSSSDRRSLERYRVRQVAEWLEEMVEKYLKDPSYKVVIKGDTVRLMKEGEEIAFFSYEESARNVYKSQNFFGLLKAVNESMKVQEEQFQFPTKNKKMPGL